MENRKHLPDFHLPFCWLFGKWDVENRTQLADFHLPFCGCFKLTSCTVITTLVWATRSHSQCGDLQLHWKLELNVDQINCTTVRITLQLCFWILQNEVQVSFFMSLILSTTTTLQYVEYLSEKKTGISTKSTHHSRFRNA